MGAKKKLIRNFETTFYIIEYDNLYLLYDKTKKGTYSPSMYIGAFSLSKDCKKYVFNNEEYNDIPSLLKAMQEFNESLPFNHEIYNPVYKKSYFVELALHEYLTSIGFVCKRNNLSSYYTLEDMYKQNICTIGVTVEDNTTNGRIIRELGEYKWTEVKFSTLDEGIAACNSVIASYCVATNSIVVSVLDKLTESRASEIEDVSFDIRTLTKYKEDAKKKAIEYLEKELEKLKS